MSEQSSVGSFAFGFGIKDDPKTIAWLQKEVYEPHERQLQEDRRIQNRLGAQHSWPQRY